MHTLSITNDGLMGSNDSTHVRSFSRYEYYLLEQAMNGKESFDSTFVKQRTMPNLNPLIVPGKGKFIRVYLVEHDLAAEYPRDARRQTGRNKERHSIRGRKTHTTLLFHQRLLLDGV